MYVRDCMVVGSSGRIDTRQTKDGATLRIGMDVLEKVRKIKSATNESDPFAKIDKLDKIDDLDKLDDLD